MQRRALRLRYVGGLLLASLSGPPGAPWASSAPLAGLQSGPAGTSPPAEARLDGDAVRRASTRDPRADLIAEVPLTLFGGWFIVEARTTRGHRLSLVFDTGTNTDGVTGSVASELDLERVGASRAHGGAGSQPVWLVRGPDLLLGGAPADDGLRAIVDDEFVTDDVGVRHDGVLGTSLLGRYDVGIDAAAGALRLYRGGRGPAGWSAEPAGAPIAFDDLGRGLIRFPVRIDGREIHAILDTGAPGMVLNSAAARALGLDIGAPSLSLAPRGVGSTSIPAARVRLGTLEVGGARFEALDAVVADLALFEALGLDSTPVLILGAPVIERCPVLVSGRSGTLRFCAAPTAVPGVGRAARTLASGPAAR